MDTELRVLGASVGRLRRLAEGLDDAQLESPSYCAEWSIAEVLSHLGSSAVIWCRLLDDNLAGRATPDEFAPSVWAEWDARSPRGKLADGLVADEALFERLERLDETERAGLGLPLGPMKLSFPEAVVMRVNEHALHTWDVEVAFDDRAHLPEDAAAVVVDHLARIVGFAARPTGTVRRVAVATSHPTRRFALDLSSEGAQLEATHEAGPANLELPAEAFCRLVYGRLDDGHCPPLHADDGVLELLRETFPGF